MYPPPRKATPKDNNQQKSILHQNTGQTDSKQNTHVPPKAQNGLAWGTMLPTSRSNRFYALSAVVTHRRDDRNCLRKGRLGRPIYIFSSQRRSVGRSVGRPAGPYKMGLSLRIIHVGFYNKLPPFLYAVPWKVSSPRRLPDVRSPRALNRLTLSSFWGLLATPQAVCCSRKTRPSVGSGGSIPREREGRREGGRKGQSRLRDEAHVSRGFVSATPGGRKSYEALFLMKRGYLKNVSDVRFYGIGHFRPITGT